MGTPGLKFTVAEQRTVGEASGVMSMSRTGVAHKTLDRMDAKYFQIIFFIIALIYTGLNIYNRFFTKMVITFLIWVVKKENIYTFFGVISRNLMFVSIFLYIF